MAARKLVAVLTSLAAGLATTFGLAFATGTLAVSSTPAVAGVPLAAPALCMVGAVCGGTSFYQAILVSTYTTFGNQWAEVSARGVYSDRSVCASPSNLHVTTFSCNTTAWRWSGTGWVQTSRGTGTSVWVQPFATGWSWTWTSGAGWLAMRDDKLVARWEPMMIAT